MTPAQLLVQARRRRDLTQAEVARRAGTSQPVISAYERGHRDPTSGTLRRLLAATGDRLELRLATGEPALPPPDGPRGHAERLVDVLLLADALPTRPRPPLAMPRMVSGG